VATGDEWALAPHGQEGRKACYEPVYFAASWNRTHTDTGSISCGPSLSGDDTSAAHETNPAPIARQISLQTAQETPSATPEAPGVDDLKLSELPARLSGGSAQCRCSDGSPKRCAVSPAASNWMSTAGSRPTTHAS
jgi:hypothetical protein